MNKRQLINLGVPEDCVNLCIGIIRDGRLTKALKKNQAKRDIPDILKSPESYTENAIWGSFATSLIAYEEASDFDDQREPISYKQWGDDLDQGSQDQINRACELPMACGAALMPDAHVGYGLPIGGVLATEGHVIPYAVGVDIACRMRMTVIDMPSETLESKFDDYAKSLQNGTRFGVGAQYQGSEIKDHDVMDQDWSITSITEHMRDRARIQLGTSGSGNHFVEFGTLEVETKSNDLGLDPGVYVALLSHSGSRGAGANVCSHYTKIAQSRLPKRYIDKFKFLAWLDLDTQEGIEYWEAMNLMGEYAAANHEVIHDTVIKILGAEAITSIENHHNFAWKETHNGKEVIVHRKGATPAGKGVLGVIPGSMADPGFVVRGKGNTDSLFSASHGAGRAMSRKAARDKFNWNIWKKEIKKRGVDLLSAGLDEVPGCYKDIRKVMQSQSDLVDILAQFNPRIVKMCNDGSKPED